MLDLPVILGTAREGNRSEWVARYAVERMAARGHITRLWTAADIGVGDLVHREWEEHSSAPSLREFAGAMAKADGFVLVFPEYNHGYPGALKNIVDHLFDEWSRKPFALVSTGGLSGGLRAAENLLPVIRGVRGMVVPAGVSVPAIAKSFTNEGPVDDEALWEKRFDAMIDDLAWWAEALAAARRARSAP